MILGFTLTKVNASRSQVMIPADLQSQNTLRLTDIKEIQIVPQSPEKGLHITFQFNVTYIPNIGTIELTGNALAKADDKLRAVILKEWSTTKKLNPQFSTNISNTILTKCNIRALQIAQELNLPPHIPFPRITAITKDEKKKEKSKKSK